MPDEIQPFRIEVPDSVLTDLRERLARTRWPEPLDDPDWDYGIEQGSLRELAEAWQGAYDWRRHEAELNAWPQLRTRIDGHDFHVLHARSPHDGALPLILTHGWPGSIVEFLDVLGPLVDPPAHGGAAADAFHVVCPSLPGYGFSRPTNAKGWHPRRIGRAWAELMRRLGYRRYVAQGGDFGSVVSQFLAREDPERCAALHLNFLFLPPPPGDLDEDGVAAAAAFRRYLAEEAAYAQLHATKPETLGYALNDSPVGLLAWIAEKFRAWTDCRGVIEHAVSRDRLLTNVTLYWVTGSAPSAARLYREARLAHALAVPPRLATPLGHARFPKEILWSPRAWLEPWYDLQHWTDMPRGGHFAALEQPALLVDDLRRFFARFR